MKNICLNYHNLGFYPQVGINKVHPQIFKNHIEVINNYIKKNPGITIDITFDDAYEDVYKYSFEVLNGSLVNDKIIFPISDYIGKLNQWDFTFMVNRYRHLNEDKIKEMSSRGWLVGSHSKTHQSLEIMNTKDALSELKESKDSIEQIIDKDVECFSPPFGIIGQRIYDLCAKVGYKKIYVQKNKVIESLEGVKIIERHNIYSIDRNRNILMKLAENSLENRKESFISSFNNLTVFFKKIIQK